MEVEEYLNIPVIKENEEFLFGNYKREFNMTAEQVLKGFVSVKDWVVDLIVPDDLNILDISGHSLFSPFLVFKQRYNSYTMFYPGERYYKINDAVFLQYKNTKISYLYTSPNYEKDKYDLILDWNGNINFGNSFNFGMFAELLRMMDYTKKWVVFQSKANLKLGNVRVSLTDFFTESNFGYSFHRLPGWAKHPGGKTFVLRKP